MHPGTPAPCSCAATLFQRWRFCLVVGLNPPILCQVKRRVSPGLASCAQHGINSLESPLSRTFIATFRPVRRLMMEDFPTWGRKTTPVDNEMCHCRCLCWACHVGEANPEKCQGTVVCLSNKPAQLGGTALALPSCIMVRMARGLIPCRFLLNE